jgi:hypothetical protein
MRPLFKEHTPNRPVKPLSRPLKAVDRCGRSTKKYVGQPHYYGKIYILLRRSWGVR